MYLNYPIGSFTALAGYVKESRLSHTASIRMTPTHGAPEKTLEVSFTLAEPQETTIDWMAAVARSGPTAQVPYVL